MYELTAYESMDVIHDHASLYIQELLMSGLPDIDVEDWEKNTEYSGYDEDSDIVKVRYSFKFNVIVLLITEYYYYRIYSLVVLGACSQF